MALALTGGYMNQPTYDPEFEHDESQQPAEGALSPDRVRFYLRLLPFRDALPRPGARVKPKHHKKRSGNPNEMTWAIYGMLLGCIQQLPVRRRSIVISCTVYGDTYDRVGQQWRCDPATAWREERRAWDDIAAMTGWHKPKD